MSRQGIGVEDYYIKANDETMTMILIEDIIAVDNLEEILAVDIDVFYVAPGDLAQSMGYPGQHNHPDVQQTVDETIARIIAAGRVAGALATDGSVEDYVEKGARLISTSYNQWLTSGAESYLDKAKAAISKH